MVNGYSSNGLPEGGSKGRALLVVTDGLGFDPDVVMRLSSRVIDALSPRTRRSLLDLALEASPGSYEMLAITRLAVLPITAEGLNAGLTWEKADETLRRVRFVRDGLRERRQLAEIGSLRRQIALENRYIPWFAEDPTWSEIVNQNLTVPTQASGVWVGYEDVDPPVQGNSETGHQQIGNLALAPQIPLQITKSIEDGSFFENRMILEAIEGALASGNNINFSFLLSGIRGSDGRVHSAWNHLEAFCELVFVRLDVPPGRVRMQAILDGRDAPAQGSLELEGVDGGYLGELERLLTRYDAVESLAWVIGRGLAMDRDYREENAICDYALLTEGAGQHVWGIDEVREVVAAYHEDGKTDADVEAIALVQERGGLATIQPGDAFINLNFRSDRQRSKTASLCGARDYLDREAKSRGRNWGFQWLRDDLNLRMCTMAEYDAEFEARYGVKVAFPITPHQLNLLSHWDRLTDDDDLYLLVAESVKASHMGYFIRGRREAEQGSKSEDRWVVPSDGGNEGVHSDSDFYVRPVMKTREIAQLVSEAMGGSGYRLIACNLAASDMVGHLLPTRFEAAAEAYRATVATLAELSGVARANGYSMVVTSDHGNIENDAPTHTVNPVLTTVLPAANRVEPRDLEGAYSANLFDVSHTVARLIGVDQQEITEIVGVFRGGLGDEFVGESIIR